MEIFHLFRTLISNHEMREQIFYTNPEILKKLTVYATSRVDISKTKYLSRSRVEGHAEHLKTIVRLISEKTAPNTDRRSF